MTPDQARQKFIECVEKDTKELAAYKLGVSVQMVVAIMEKERNPSLTSACAIMEVYEIPIESWCVRPASRMLQQAVAAVV